ncbi:MAG: hypothetical protein GYB66_06430, partial [Chloroflexi bacterium]|nr:hypothetical protein [Chloroflexota bacterium]
MYRLLIPLIAISLLTIAFFPTPISAQDDPTGESQPELAQETYQEINQGLIEQNLRPLGRNATLDEIAETIANELSATGQYTSVPRALAGDLGYPTWPDGGQRVINQAINHIGIETPAEFTEIWLPEIVDILESTFYREIGVAVTTRVAVEGGTIQYVYVVVMGAQPNGIPLVINDGAETVYSRKVNLYIHNEFSLAYETDADTMQRANEVRISNREDEIEDAEWMSWDDNNFEVDWQLSEGYGEKTVWVELQDEKGVIVRSHADVTYADPATAPTPTPDPGVPSVQLLFSYQEDTFTIQVSSEAATVNLQELYFTWLDDTRAYELENADDLASLDLREFSSSACIQIRLRDQPATEVDGCDPLYLEANEFTDLERVFWNPEFETFSVLDGPRFLGVCETQAGSCTIQLR